MTGSLAGALMARSVDVSVRPSHATDVWTVSFRTEARPGTLAALAGTLTAAGLDIVSAVVSVTADGTALDAFDVIPLDGRMLGHSDEPELARLATDALEGRRDLAGDLAAIRHAAGHIVAEPPQIEMSTDSELTTGIKVVCTDRIGLLFDLTNVLTKHRLRTRAISVLTFRGRAHDTFRVVDASGEPPKSAAVLDALRADLAAACG